MWGRPLGVLVATDLQLHGRSIVAAHAGGLAILGAGVYFAPSQNEAALSSFVFNLNLLATLVWAEWIVSREKVKGTFAWLRTLPVTDLELVGAKFCTHALCCVSFWTVTSLGFLRARYFPHDVGTWAVLTLVLVTFGGLSVATRWRFPQKLGHVLPPVVALVFVLPVLVARRMGLEVVGDLARLWGTAAGQASVAALLFVAYALVGWATVWWVARSDTSRLVE